jgi:hypothetical protein
LNHRSTIPKTRALTISVTAGANVINNIYVRTFMAKEMYISVDLPVNLKIFIMGQLSPLNLHENSVADNIGPSNQKDIASRLENLFKVSN